MKKLNLALTIIISLVVLTASGCELLPPLPQFSPTPSPTTQVPSNLSAAAERILPATVIVDTRFATGTGWVLDSSGIIVTNYHVIEDAQSIVVTLHDGRRFSVRSAASDPVGDLAILRIDASGLPAAVLGSSAALRVGDPVVAVGNSNGEGISVKVGAVTGLNMTVGIENEQFYGLIEDNAPIAEGDSGGPLVNKNGEVVGISNAKVIGLENIAYAINIDSALPILQQLITNGSVARPYLGIMGSDNFDGVGVYIEEVTPGGPADGAGLRPGDIILALDGVTVDGIDELKQAIRAREVGERIIITYRRGSARSDTTAVLVQYPSL